jgi:phage terminase large subunit-like protein
MSDSGSTRAERYADQVLSGEVVAPELVRQACQRFRDDQERSDLIWDRDKADIAVRNIERMPHVKGRWRGKPIVLEDWQCFAVANIFGWLWASTGKRRFRYAYLQIPRKNGKTLLSVCISLLMFACDGEPGAEVYLGATSQDQARELLLFPAKQIVNMCKPFKNHYGIEVGAQALTIPESFSRLKSVIKKPDDGYNPHCAAVDEFHEHETDDQFETFDTGMGSREQPLLLVTTTAGSNLASPCKEYRDECVQGLTDNDSDSRFILIYEPDAEDDWDDPETLRKVNPNIGVSVSEDYLLDQLSQARKSAGKQNAFKTKHLNMWVGAKVAWMNMVCWQRQYRPQKLEDFAGRPAWLGLDLASKKDVAAIGIIIPEGSAYNAFVKLYAPEAAAEDNEIYRKYQTAGELVLTPGSATDYGFIENDLAELATHLDVQAVGFDEWQAQYLAQRMMERGMEMESFPHQVRTMSDPMKELEALVLDGRLWHNGNSALNWMMGNVMVRQDAKDNIFPTKSNPADPRCKIDGVVALIMAMGLAVREREEGSMDDWLQHLGVAK